MNKHEDYHRNAFECLWLAQDSKNPSNKAILLEMAQVWIDLSDQLRDAECRKENRPQSATILCSDSIPYDKDKATTF
jgi:hypothetical protein